MEPAIEGRPILGHKLHVKIIEGKDLLACDFNGFSDPYVKIHIEPDSAKEHKRKTSVVKKDLNPVFNQEFDWKIPENMKLAVSWKPG